MKTSSTIYDKLTNCQLVKHNSLFCHVKKIKLLSFSSKGSIIFGGGNYEL